MQDAVVAAAVEQDWHVGRQQDPAALAEREVATALAKGEFTAALVGSEPLVFTPFTHPGRTPSAGDHRRERHPRDQQLQQLVATDEDQL